ncbi:TPA: hypothetical protein JD836_14850 [Citrobacter freundii]|nr:hypothetical protein [Citrobacter freundii]HCD1268080.1 hypothetical protein [Citrobacter freundii]
MTSAIHYEKKFREFLTVKRQWLDLLNQHLRFRSENAVGQSMRPIAVTDDIAVLEQAQDLLRQWNRFAKFADEYRKNGGASGSSNDYFPVPFMISGAVKVSINEGTAQAISKVSREKIIGKLERRLNTLRREGNPDSIEVQDCLFDLERFNKYEFGTIFRRRLAGYADTIINVQRMNEDEIIYRAGSWGVLIDNRLLKDDVHYHKKDKQIKSFYEYCTPIPCSLYDSGALYLETEVVRVKEERRLHPKREPIKRKRRPMREVYDESQDN